MSSRCLCASVAGALTAVLRVLGAVTCAVLRFWGSQHGRLHPLCGGPRPLDVSPDVACIVCLFAHVWGLASGWRLLLPLVLVVQPRRCLCRWPLLRRSPFFPALTREVLLLPSLTL